METESVVLPHDPSLGMLLMFAHRVAKHCYTDALASYGLTPAHVEILRLLLNDEASYVSSLAEKYHVTPPVLSDIVTLLEDRGLVTRHRDAGDRRRHRLMLTDEGVRLTHEVLAIRDRLNARLAHPLDADELAQLKTSLQKIITSLEADNIRDDE